MTSSVRRAGAFAVVGTLAFVGPLLHQSPLDLPTVVAEWAPPFPFALAALGAFAIRDGMVFDLFARPGDREDGRLYGLLGFTLAATALGILSGVGELPLEVFVGTVLLVAYGNLAAQIAKTRWLKPVVWTVAFVIAGTLACLAGEFGVALIKGQPLVEQLPTFVFLAATGGLLGGLLRAVLFARDDALVMLSVGLLLWFLHALVGPVGGTEVAIALVVTIALGYVSYELETASIPGMVTGVLLALLTIVLGGYGWFVILVAFFGIGGLATKFRYDQKAKRGIAEDNEGARGSGNVLGNSAVALAAVLAHAGATGELLGISASLSPLFAAAFGGSLATALADTLSSEIGGLYDDPRLITTFDPVEPGTDGAVTWQGELAGIAGAGLVAIIAIILVPAIPSGVIVLLGGVAGMTVDSLLGASLEGNYLGNQGVNFFATLSGAIVAAGLLVVIP